MCSSSGRSLSVEMLASMRKVQLELLGQKLVALWVFALELHWLAAHRRSPAA